MTGKIEWRLTSKTILFGFGLWFLSVGDFSLGRFILFFVLLFVLYFSEPIEERRRFRVSFWLIPVLSIIFLVLLPGYPIYIPLLFAIFGLSILIFIVLGLIRYVISHQSVVYEVLNTLVFILLFLVWGGLSGDKALFTIWPLLGVFLASFFLLRESFSFVFGQRLRRFNIFALSGALFLSQTAFLLYFLPLGALNSAAFLALLVVMVRSGFTSHILGSLNSSFILRHFTVFAAIIVIILAATNWTP